MKKLFPSTDFGCCEILHGNAFYCAYKINYFIHEIDSLSYAKVPEDHVQYLLHAHFTGDSAELPDGRSQFLGSHIQMKVLSSSQICRSNK